MSNLFKIIFILAIFWVAIYGQDDMNDTIFVPDIDIEAERLGFNELTAPGKLTIFNERYISSLNSGRLSDILNFAGGIYIKEYGFNTGIKTISFNSTQSEHTIIMLDGVKLNSAQNSLFDLSSLNTDNIQSVEILSGGNSSLYGSEAIGGAVNIITGKGRELYTIGLDAHLGSYGYQKYSGMFTKSFKNFNLMMAMGQERGNNDFEYNYYNGFSNVSGIRTNSAHKNNFFDLKINTAFKDFNVNIYSLYNDGDRELPPAVNSVQSLSSKLTDKSVISGIHLSKVKDNIKYKINFDHKYNYQKYYDPNSFNTQVPINSFYKINSFINSGGIEIKNFADTRWYAGYEIDKNIMNSNETRDASQIHFASYVSANYHPSGWLTIYPSARFDHYSNIDKNILSGKLGFNFRPMTLFGKDTNSLSLKASAAANHRVPAFNDLYWNELGNPELKPEYAVSFDAGIYYTFELHSQNIVELNYTNIDTKDRIVWNPDVNGIWRPANIGRVVSNSLDISYKNSSDKMSVFGWEFSIGYNISSAIKRSEDNPGDPSFKKQMIYIPQEMARSYLFLDYNIGGKILKSVSLNTFYSYTGKRYLDAENLNFIKYYELLDANLSFSFNLFKVSSTVKFAVNNILDEQYEMIPGYPMPMRNYKVHFSFKY